MLFKDADKSINIGKKHKWADTTALDYTTNEVCNVRKTDIADLIIALLSQLIKKSPDSRCTFRRMYVQVCSVPDDQIRI